ncbi:hypothetical protein AWC38_SpisGene9809 [Stylophora pistillata]|uniref:Uncharacterized protein n=1 Tax=Stylophora pistillata TaxID=50429 RepID=A0A2B4S854_STYPI|nr:hypothetical protein AWC38_SpisGene9809 [Stylophora pistillata]
MSQISGNGEMVRVLHWKKHKVPVNLLKKRNVGESTHLKRSISSSVELGIQEGYLSANQKSELVWDVCTSINRFTSHPKHFERQWIAKKIVEEHPCMAGKKLVDSDTEWIKVFNEVMVGMGAALSEEGCNREEIKNRTSLLVINKVLYQESGKTTGLQDEVVTIVEREADVDSVVIDYIQPQIVIVGDIYSSI